MINENEGTSYERLRCLNQSLIFNYTNTLFKQRNIMFEKAQQRTLGLIDEDGYYTNLGLLLSEQCEYSIKCAVYNGNTKLEFRDRREFSGSILHQLNDVYEYISLQNKMNSSFEGLRRIDKLEYPIYAIREALLGKCFSVVVAEGTKSIEEAFMNKSKRKEYRDLTNHFSIAHRIGKMIEAETGFETRIVTPGHILRGGSPTAYDRTLATCIGAFGVKLIEEDNYGKAVSVKNNECVDTLLELVAGLKKKVTENDHLVELLGIPCK